MKQTIKTYTLGLLTGVVLVVSMNSIGQIWAVSKVLPMTVPNLPMGD